MQGTTTRAYAPSLVCGTAAVLHRAASLSVGFYPAVLYALWSVFKVVK
jgi:hypothetical protein